MLLAALLLVPALLVAEQDSEPKLSEGPQNLGADKLALAGYDAVAYHTEEKPVMGDPAITATYAGGVFRFASAENREVFVADPEYYLPAYGGYCAFGFGVDPEAYGVTPGRYQVNPKSFAVIDGRLHLFYRAGDFDGLAEWRKDQEGAKQRADVLWAGQVEGENKIREMRRQAVEGVEQ